jgi:hypothetical protein
VDAVGRLDIVLAVDAQPGDEDAEQRRLVELTWLGYLIETR